MGCAIACYSLVNMGRSRKKRCRSRLALEAEPNILAAFRWARRGTLRILKGRGSAPNDGMNVHSERSKNFTFKSESRFLLASFQQEGGTAAFLPVTVGLREQASTVVVHAMSEVQPSRSLALRQLGFGIPGFAVLAVFASLFWINRTDIEAQLEPLPTSGTPVSVEQNPLKLRQREIGSPGASQTAGFL